MSKRLAVIALLIVVGSFARADVKVGAIAGTMRYTRADVPPAVCAVSLSAARNEWRSFQILLQSTAEETVTSVTAGDLIGPDGAVIPASSASLYREHQLEITMASNRNFNFKAGYYPDALIPFKNPEDGALLTGGRFKAVPFLLPAGETHGFWVDLFVPRNTRPGTYTGEYKVRFAHQPMIVVPVTLTVWGFTLPDTPSLMTRFGDPGFGLARYYRAKKLPEPADWKAVYDQCDRLTSQNRCSAENCNVVTLDPELQPDGTYTVPPAVIKAIQSFVDTYHTNIFCLGNPAGWGFTDPVADNAKLLARLRACDTAIAQINRPVLYYIYLSDEANDAAAYKYIRDWGKAIRAAHSAAKVLVVEQPKPQDPAWGDLYGAVDIWCTYFALYDGPAEASRQALGETVWAYTALTEVAPCPYWEIDFPLLNYRAPAWIAWSLRDRGLLYSGNLIYWDDVDDPWTQPMTLTSKTQEKNNDGTVTYKTQFGWNGESNLTYPAREVGYDGIVPSMRLKAIRDSAQDYDYMAILERAGLAAEAQSIVNGVVKSWTVWSSDPQAYDAARLKLANLIVQRGLSR